MQQKKRSQNKEHFYVCVSRKQASHFANKTFLNCSFQISMVILITILNDLVSSNVYAKCYQNIPKGSRDRASFTFSEFEPRQILDNAK